MQINVATGDAIIYASQDNITESVTISSKREKLERHIHVMKRHLENEKDEQTICDFLEEIKECEEELEKLS